VLRRISGCKRNGMKGTCRKWHDETLHSLYFLSNIIRVIKSRRIRKAKHVGHGEIRNACTILSGKPEWKRPLGRHRRRWKDIIKMEVRRTGIEGVD
jgi:hypothetical protein